MLQQLAYLMTEIVFGTPATEIRWRPLQTVDKAGWEDQQAHYIDRHALYALQQVLARTKAPTKMPKLPKLIVAPNPFIVSSIPPPELIQQIPA